MDQFSQGRPIDHGFDLAEALEAQLWSLPDWQIVSPAQLGIVTFRYAGISDRVDRHSGEVLKSVAMSTLLGIGSELTISGNNEVVDALRSAVQSSSNRAGDQIVSRGLGIRPTIIVRPGTPIRLLVHQDLVIEPSSARSR